MAGPQATKRARANTAGEATAPSPAPKANRITGMKVLTNEQVKELLLQAAAMYPEAHSLVTNTIQETTTAREIETSNAEIERKILS